MYSRIAKKARRAFTLVEIMIVVLIIGILLAIAIPNFVHARESSRAKACQGNLKQLNGATEQMAMEMHLPQGAFVSVPLVPNYIKTLPVCPSGGTYGPINPTVGEIPTCSIGTQQGYNDHVLP